MMMFRASRKVLIRGLPGQQRLICNITKLAFNYFFRTSCFKRYFNIIHSYPTQYVYPASYLTAAAATAPSVLTTMPATSPLSPTPAGERNRSTNLIIYLLTEFAHICPFLSQHAKHIRLHSDTNSAIHSAFHHFDNIYQIHKI